MRRRWVLVDSGDGTIIWEHDTLKEALAHVLIWMDLFGQDSPDVRSLALHDMKRGEFIEGMQLLAAAALGEWP